MRIMTDLCKISRLRWTKEITARYIITLEYCKPIRRPTVRLDKLSNLTAGSRGGIVVAKNVWLVIACVAGGSGYPRELQSRTQVQKAAQVARRMGRSLVEFPPALKLCFFE